MPNNNNRESNTNLNTKCITDESHFLNLSEEWNLLAEKTESSSVFHRHEWFNAAWQWKKMYSTLNILVVYDNNTTIGICPLVRINETTTFLKLKSLEFLAIPDTQFCDVITSAQNHQKTLEAVMNWLIVNNDSWDKINLNYLKSDSCTLNSLQSSFGKFKYHYKTSNAGINPYIDMATTWSEYYATRSRRLKKGNNLAANKLKREGELRVESNYSKEIDPEMVSSILANVVDISENSWKNTTGVSLDQTGPNNFISSLTAISGKSGWLSIWILRLEDKPIAMEYQLIYDNTAYALRADFIEDYSALSPGTYLNWKILEELFKLNISRYYMGPGNNKYKKRWTEIGDKQSGFIGYSKNWQAKVFYTYEEVLKPQVKKLLLSKT